MTTTTQSTAATADVLLENAPQGYAINPATNGPRELVVHCAGAWRWRGGAEVARGTRVYTSEHPRCPSYFVVGQAQRTREEAIEHATQSGWAVGTGSRNNRAGWVVYRHGAAGVDDPVYSTRREAMDTLAERGQRRTADPMLEA